MARFSYLLITLIGLFMVPFSLGEGLETGVQTIENRFQTENLNALRKEIGMQRSDLVSNFLLHKAQESFDQGRLSHAITEGLLAAKISPTSPIPHFFLSRAYWAKSMVDIPNFLSQYLTALQLTFYDFWSLFSLFGTLLLLLIAAYFSSLLFFTCFSIYLYAPLWIHQISESSRGTLHPISATFVFISLLLSPLFLGIPMLWFFLFSFLLFWHFYSRSERWIVFIFLIGLGASAFILPFSLTFITAKQSVHLNEMVKNHHADYFWSSPSTETNPQDWKNLFLLGSFEAQEKNYARAKVFYNKSLALNPESQILLNNLGNVSFYLKEYPEALDYYQQAIARSPKLASAHYIISQTHREMLDFEEGERKFQEALRINRKSVEHFAKLAAEFPDFPVMEEHFSKMDLWGKIFEQYTKNRVISEEIWQGWVGRISLNSAPVLSGFWLFILFSSAFFYKKFITAQTCISCQRPICRRCHEKIFSYTVCGICGVQFKSIRNKNDFELIEESVKKIPKKLFPFFLFPGGGHIAIKRFGVGFLFFSLFLFFVSYIYLADVFFSSSPWHLHQSKWIWVLLSLSALYLLSFLDLARNWSSRLWH